MNTVLDDNKKLCLTSGEIIALTPQMRMIFEVEDLAVASPATVSRCGMVYQEPKALGIAPLLPSWLGKLPSPFPDTMKQTLKSLFNAVVQPMIRLVRKDLQEVATTQDNALVISLFRLMDCYFQPFQPKEDEPVNKEEVENVSRRVSPLFVFCTIWSLGAAIEAKCRTQFSTVLYEKLRGLDIPLDGLDDDQRLGKKSEAPDLYDMCFQIQSGQWVPWDQVVPPYSVPDKSTYESIVVPTKDSIRLTQILQTLILGGQHVLVPGSTGTGKTCYIDLWLQKAPAHIMSASVAFSAQTHVNQLQDFLDSKFEKRRRGVYGAPNGKKVVVFVDDLNMPQKEYYGAQPPIELLRLWFDHGGWYDRKELAFFQIIDILMISAMGRPGGGRTFITERLKRHYNNVAAADMADDSVEKIFTTMSAYFFFPFSDTVQNMVPFLVKAAINIFQLVGEELLPTPEKSHYIFNLRDLWKIFQGLCSLHVKKVPEAKGVAACFLGELERVFRDRLVNKTDQEWYDTTVQEKWGNEVVARMGKVDVSMKNVLGDAKPIFIDFMEKDADVRYYELVPDIETLQQILNDHLQEYNEMMPVRMPLVMFSDACEHVSRICRVLRQPRGNSLLLGVGGSGRQSLARLASFVNNFDLFQIEVAKGYGMNEFREDLKTCLLKAGTENRVQTFLLGDTQIAVEQMVEAMNNILNSGDMPNLYKVEDTETIMNACRAKTQQSGLAPTKTNIFATYVNEVRSNLHVVLAFSPSSEQFRARLRMFPSLVNCCTIDWFHEWPAEALFSVGMQQLSSRDLLLGNLGPIINCMRTVHMSVDEASHRYKKESDRATYVTPTSYLELIEGFVTVLHKKRDELSQLKNRLQKGLGALDEAAYAVANMEKELVAMQPVLVNTQKEVAELMTHIKEDKQKADVTKAECETVEAEATAQDTKATAIKNDAQRDLDEALPALDIAVKCLKALQLKHLQEVKNLSSPPAGVKLTMEAICVMFQVKPVMKADPNVPGKKIPDFWEATQKNVLIDPKKLLEDLFDFDKDNIPEPVIKKIEPYIHREDFDAAAIKKASVACEALCLWVRAMYKYHFIAKAVAPKKAQLMEAEAELAITREKLDKAKADLQVVEDKLAKLDADYKASIQKQNDLQREIEMCGIKLENANKLIGGLGGEKERWANTVQQLERDMVFIPGDSLLCAGMVSYCGPFIASYRTHFEKTWQQCFKDNDVNFTENGNLTSLLGKPVRIQEWAVFGLPNDTLSVENAIMLDQARRWSLMIDPQRQANKFVKNYGKAVNEAGMEICKLSDSNMIRTLELGIQFGKWVLLENIGTTLDPTLEPVLLQQKIKDGAGWAIRLGDKQILYVDSFRFFMTTTLPNPHYPPEISVKVTLLNFAITPAGLEDQMLGLVVREEKPDIEEKKRATVESNAAMSKTLQDIEDTILRLLSAEGNVLESRELIETLETSKTTSEEINVKMAESKVTEKEIDEARTSYKRYAERASIIFFCVTELSVIDPMYQFSLLWFQTLATLGIQNAAYSDDPNERLDNLIDYFTYSIYTAVCRGLFEAHKLLFSFALIMKLKFSENKVDQTTFRFLLTGATMVVTGPENPASEWLGNQEWGELLALSKIAKFKGIDEHFANNVTDLKRIYDSADAQNENIGGKWDEHLDEFEKLCVLRCIRLDKMVPAIVGYVLNGLGKRFVEPPSFSIKVSYLDSTKVTPLIFVLTQGSDPVGDMYAFAEEMQMAKKLESISLGQGQGPKAVRLIEVARQQGGWVLLANCHLAVSWLPELDRLCERMSPEDTHNDFRLWLTSMPTPVFPPLLLQNSVKMTNEPPKGLRANLMGTIEKLDEKILEESKRPEAFRRLLFAFCFFHTIVLARRKFGPIGWCIPYSFTNEDLTTCRRQLLYFLESYEEIPYDVLNFLGAQINYGGRVTDARDKRLISAILSQYVCSDLVTEGEMYKFSRSGQYYCPDGDTLSDIIAYLSSLPLQESPEAFGLHENCEITCAQDEANTLLGNMLQMAPKSGGSGGGGSGPGALMDSVANGMQEQCPALFDLDLLEQKFPTMYSESLNTVLKQESLKLNRLISKMLETLPLFRRALKGLVVMNEELESIGNAFLINGVPNAWANVGFLSLKPLAAWIIELNQRRDFLGGWADNGQPNAYWISGFFFPQAFLTGTLQNYARRHRLAIDIISFGFTVMDKLKVDASDLQEKVDEGVICYGFFLEGCRWDPNTHVLNVSYPKVLYPDMYPVHFVPTADRKPPPSTYECPVYKVLSRKGTLSTTGHSTNFVLYLELPTRRPADDWLRAGVAIFLSLKY
jgi:dynein heavy chain